MLKTLALRIDIYLYVLISPQLFGIIKGLRKTKCNKGLFSKMSFLIFGLD